ncbi:EAL domain-containing protein [Chthonobacter albigriseus]|uniref:EAL domain-containing protein n=1 Tax=Chthonobacter albigriseus TaxID=1683161 RepID=UPI0015EE6187|nr:EAL domain-containing protein [Chthonobacter albigriseus]
MSRLSTILIVMAMVVTAVSIAVVLNLQFDFPLGQSAALGLVALFGLALLHVQGERTRDRKWLEARISEISAVAGDVNTEVDNIASRLSRLETGLPERIRQENEALAVEIEVVGTLMKQVADALADVEARFDRRLDDVSHKLEANRLPPPQPRFEPQPQPRISASRFDPPPQPQAPPRYDPPAPPQPRFETAPAPYIQAQPAPPPPQPAYQRVEVIHTPTHVPAPAAMAPPPPPAPPAPPRMERETRVEPRFEAPPVQVEPAGRSHGLGPLAGPGVPPPVVVAPPPAPEPPRIPTPFEREVETAIRAERIEVHLQPIVTLPQRKVRYYEVLTRLRGADGRLIPAGEFIPAAEYRRMMPKLDTFQVIRSFQILKRLTTRNREMGLFVNLAVSSLVDPTFFREFHTFLSQNKPLADLVQFEFTHEAVTDMGPLEMESLATLSDLGYRFSIDHVSDLRLEFQQLFDVGFRTLKISADRLLGRAPLGGGDIHPADLNGHLGRKGFTLVVDRVEAEAQVVDLLEFEVKLAQGNLFSAPRQVRPEILAAQPGGAAVASQPQQQSAPTPQPQPAAGQGSAAAPRPAAAPAAGAPPWTQVRARR